MKTRRNTVFATISICATLIAGSAILSGAGNPTPPSGPIQLLNEIHDAVACPECANEFTLLVDEPAVDGQGAPTWINVVQGDGILLRVVGSATGHAGRQLLRDGSGRPLGDYFSSLDSELGIPFTGGIQAMPVVGTTVSIMLVYKPTP
jgi:hypothetical protein